MEEQRVTIAERSEGNVAVISIGGRLDATSSSAASGALEQSISQGKNTVILDLSDLTYTSSSGLRAFLAALKQLRKAGGEMLIAHPGPHVLEVFTIAGFDRIFPIYGTVDEAVAAVKKA